ncbi:dienelactone hydrolase family protein [Phreatobacter sp. AB_2022a]|uniref:dienelactone hydrolase family protein n=1 Tax=Phreatobacter sp. AB_2022a TaxID=3003134 RepID=UPI002286CE68|nr:dienelactone hydrolase family protein [Phreatobacter sp. AB_2022a]MCZ0732857.1 dienelactone hydrolase family protein [Phreatobacter sp. AB_2022a]
MTHRGTIIRRPMADGAEIDIYHIEPAGRRRGGLVLIQEIFGLTDHIRDQCDRFAGHGYEVLAPALFDREAPGLDAPYTAEGIALGMKVAREQHPFELSVTDTQSCIDMLEGAGPVFITGYCYGGSVTYAAAARCRGLAAASGYYGGMIPRMADERPRCPTILHFGRKDAGIPLDAVEAFAKARPEVEVHLYDAGHGFNSDRRTDYDEPSARLALERTLALFQAHGG